MGITKSIEKEKDIFVDKLVDLCRDLTVDAVRISEVKYIGENHGYEEYSEGHVRAYGFFKNLNVIVEKTSNELITTGCIDIFNYRGIEFHLKRLCGFKIKSNIQTFKVVYSNGDKADDWIYDGIAIKK